MYAAVKEEVEKLLELTDRQELIAKKISANTIQSNRFWGQLSEIRERLVETIGNSSYDEKIKVALTKTMILLLGQELLWVSDEKNELWAGSKQYLDLSERERFLRDEIDQHNRLLSDSHYKKNSAGELERELVASLKTYREKINSIRKESEELFEESKEVNKDIDQTILNLANMFEGFDKIRSEIKDVLGSIGLQGFSQEIINWSQDNLPRFSRDVREISNSLEKLRVRAITRYAPLRLILENQAVDYEKLEAYVLDNVSCFDKEVCRNFIYELSDDAIITLSNAALR